MPAFVWMQIRFFVLSGCPVCRKLLGYKEGDDELYSVFQEDCKIKHVLLDEGFNVNAPFFASGKVKFEKLRRGSQLRLELAEQYSKPNRMTDLLMRRLIKYAKDYGVNVIRNSIFIDRVEVINLNHPVRRPLMYRFQLHSVPTVSSPYAPNGMLRGLSSEEPELEIKRLLFTGGSAIRPAEDVTKI
jgi:thiol-disulfide isomerase/thioredoxin